MGLTAQKVKEKVDEANRECWDLIVKKINDLELTEDHKASWVFVQRVCNILWMKANPHAEYIISKTMKDEVQGETSKTTTEREAGVFE